MNIKKEILYLIDIPESLLDYLLNDGSIKTANKQNCGLSRRAAINLLNIESQGLKESNQPWRFFLESLTIHKYCRQCNSYKARNTDYHSKKASSDGLADYCKSCVASNVNYYSDVEVNRERSKRHYEANKEYYSEKAIRRRALQLSRIPKWANIDKIKEIYKNRPEDCHVDHIIPLQGKNVCGLHVETNLQYLSIADNLKKSNNF